MEQDIDTVMQKSPMIPEELHIFAARKPNPSNPNGCKDFKINKQNTMTWLKFLKQNNKNCMDIEIDEHALNHLPEDGSIFDNLRHREDDEEEIESNMGGNAQGPEQGHATGDLPGDELIHITEAYATTNSAH